MRIDVARELGRVRRRHGRGRRGWEIDLGKKTRPRFLYSNRGMRFASEDAARATLDAIRDRYAKGETWQQAVDHFAPESSARNRVSTWARYYLDEQVERHRAGEISWNHRRELRRAARPEGTWGWWWTRPLGDIATPALRQWAAWLARERGLGPKSRRNQIGYFRAFTTWLHEAEAIRAIPAFPKVPVPDHRPTLLGAATQARILDAIPWERRGAFLAACHGVRPGEVRALDLTDFEHRDLPGRPNAPGLVVSKAKQGPNANAETRHTKTREAAWIPVSDDLAAWIVWRLRQRTKESPVWRSRALFPNPSARRPERRWIANALREEWNRAAAKVRVRCRMYEGTKHSSVTRWLSQGGSLEFVQRMLRHRERRSTERYAKLTDAGLLKAFARLEGVSTVCPEPEGREKVLRNRGTSGGADGTRTRNFRRDRPVL
jgi:site-specific recombinase XerC